MKRAIIALLIIASAGAGAGVYYVRRAGPEIGQAAGPFLRLGQQIVALERG